MESSRRRVVEGQHPSLTDDKVRLQFNELLTWRPGQPIALAELLRRLEKLAKELEDFDQDNVDKDSLAKVAEALAHRNLLQHKDRGVKAYVACCLVDILRLCAPDAPFNAEQLKAIFTLIVKSILPALQDRSDTYNSQHKYILTSLVEVKSVVLLSDIDGVEELIIGIFGTFFDGVSNAKSGEQIAKDVIQTMSDLLVILIEEGPSIQFAVIEVIMAQFLRAAPPGGRARPDRRESNSMQSTLLPKTEPPAYTMARFVCNACPEKMSRYVSQYFSDVILDVSSFAFKSNGHHNAEEQEDFVSTEPSEADLKNLKQAHLLVRELWRATPQLLPNVVSQVEAELSADSVHLRQISTETIGDMISGIGAAGPPPEPVLDPSAYPPIHLTEDSLSRLGYNSGNVLTTPLAPVSFGQTHRIAYQSFLGRRMDKSWIVRASWTTAVGYILATSAGGIGLSRDDQLSLVNWLGEKLSDNDDRVRLAAVKSIGLMNFRDVVIKLGAIGGVDQQGSVLSVLADRCRDKKQTVRVEAMTLLARLWAVATGEIADGNETVIACLGSAPSRILNAFYVNDKDLNVLLDRVLFEYLVPLGFPPPKVTKTGKGVGENGGAGILDLDNIRAERILLLIKCLDSPAKKAFFAMQKNQPSFAKVLETFIQHCEKYNGGTVLDPATDNSQALVRLDGTISYLVQFLPDTTRPQHEFRRFAKGNDQRAYQLIRFAISSDSDYKTVFRAIKELVRRLGTDTSPGILDHLLPLLYRASCLMFNRSHLHTMIEISKSPDASLGAVAHEVLNEISQHLPDRFKTYAGQLCKDLTDQAPTEERSNSLGAVDVLKAFSSYARSNSEKVPSSRAFVNTMINYALFATPAKAAKYAVNIMMSARNEHTLVNATNLVRKIMNDWTYGSPHFLNKLYAVSQLELFAPSVTLEYDDAIREMVVETILFQVRTDAREGDDCWVADSEMGEELMAKCTALKVLVNRIRAIDDAEESKKRAQPVFKLLKSLVTRGGEMSKGKETPNPHRSRLRLLAAQLLLKLCAKKHLDELLTADDFNKLAVVTQDAVPQVRRGFVEKLQKYIAQRKLRFRFHTIIFLTAYEPVLDFKHRVEVWIGNMAKRAEYADHQLMEPIMARLISLLAHHPDYGTTLDELADHARYLLYYVSTVATEANIGLIYKYAERVKQTLDAIDPTKSENLYVLSDLAQTVIRKWQERRNWVFQAYAGKVGLPIGLYSTLGSHDTAQRIAEQQYIPDEIDDRLDEILKAHDKGKKRKAMTENQADQLDQSEQPSKKARTEPKTPRKKISRDVEAVSDGVAKKAVKRSGTGAAKQRKQEATTSSSPSRERRRSGRATNRISYAEEDDDDGPTKEDDEEIAESEEEENNESDESGEAIVLSEAEGADEFVEEVQISESTPPPSPPRQKARGPKARKKSVSRATQHSRSRRARAGQDEIYDSE